MNSDRKEYHTNIDDFINIAIKDTEINFKSIINHKNLSFFKQYLIEYIELTIINNWLNGIKNIVIMFGNKNGNNTPTSNIGYALIASGISPTGFLPENTLYSTKKLLPNENIVKKILENRKNSSFIEVQIDNIYKWLNESEKNKNADPNAFELIELFIKMNNIRNIGGNISEKTEQQLKEIWENRKNNYIKNEIGADNLSYILCEHCYNGILSKSYIDLATMRALQKMAAVDLFFHQEKRNGNKFIYNEKEIKDIKNYIKAAEIMGSNLKNYSELFFNNIAINI